MKIKIKKLHPNAIIPTYAHGPDEDAGMDLCAVENKILYKDFPTLIKTGLSIELPPGYEAQIRSRSGLALNRGIYVLNAPGTVDPGYRGEIGVVLCWNGFMHGDGPTVRTGDRIAQLVIARYEPVEWESGDLSTTNRGDGGFGSTGH